VFLAAFLPNYFNVYKSGRSLPESSTLLHMGTCLTRKYKTNLIKLAIDKHSSFLYSSNDDKPVNNIKDWIFLQTLFKHQTPLRNKLECLSFVFGPNIIFVIISYYFSFTL